MLTFLRTYKVELLCIVTPIPFIAYSAWIIPSWHGFLMLVACIPIVFGLGNLAFSEDEPMRPLLNSGELKQEHPGDFGVAYEELCQEIVSMAAYPESMKLRERKIHVGLLYHDEWPSIDQKRDHVRCMLNAGIKDSLWYCAPVENLAIELGIIND